MHEEWTKPTPWDNGVKLLACFICGERLDEQIQLHRLFMEPKREPKLLIWDKIRQQVLLDRERRGIL